MLGRSMPPAPGPDAVKALNPKEDGKGRVLGSPFLAQLYLFCCSDQFREQRKPFKTIWDVPYALACHFYLVSLEINGAIKIENEQEHEIQAEVDQLQAEVDAEVKDRKPDAPRPNEFSENPGLATPPPDLGD